MVSEPQEEQSPAQPEKIEPESGTAVRVKDVLKGYGSEQSKPQLMPDGLLVTVPLPVPDLVRETV